MTGKIRFWQWPNILAIDAGIIAVAWLWFFAEQQSVTLGATPYLVLALSVWLTYISDRLFDARPRIKEQLLSARHQFAKRRGKILWLVWAPLLVLNILLAMGALSQSQLEKGFTLLLLCLAYTALNQSLSRRFFPKELLVALIFAGGTQVFLPSYTPWSCLLGFVLLCLINCLLIGWQEKSVDALLQVRSLSSIVDPHWTHPLLLACLGLSCFSSCSPALLPSLLALGALYCCRLRFGTESFRVLGDAALLAGPIFYWALHKL